MSSCENGVSGWNLRHVRGRDELLDPVASPGGGSRFAPEEPLGATDRCLHIPGKADSAYSSFSGGSNLPEYPVPLCYSEQDSLSLEQPYMDTGYVRGIYNPCAIKEEVRQMYGNKGSGKSSHYQSEITGHSRLHGSIPDAGALHQSSPPLGRSPLPCPPAQVESYQGNTRVHQTTGICVGCSIPAEVCIREPSKGLLSDTSTKKCYRDGWFSRCHGETLVTATDAEYLAKPCPAKEKDSSIFITPSAFFQEEVMPHSSQEVLQARNATHAFTIPETMNSDSSPLLQTSHKAVNDTQKNKQGFYAGSVHKPPTAEGGLPSAVAVSRQPEGQLHWPLQLFRRHGCPELEPGIYVSTAHLKYVDSPLPSQPGLGIINSYEEKKGFVCSEEENSRDSWQPPLKQQTTMQKPHYSPGLDFAETPRPIIYEPTNTVSYYSCDAEDTRSQSFNGFGKSEENDHSSPELLMNSRHEEMLKTVGFPNQPFSNKKAERRQGPPEDSVSEKINRKTTPLLYYLSGGKNPSVMSHAAPHALDPEASCAKPSRSLCPGSAVPVEILGDNPHCVDKTVCTGDGLLLEPSSLDEKFQNDYREKLKVAQSKVLRETSFKRKDLQMSLPIRLKQKASSRPSIQHLRSWSLSSTNEEPKSVPPLQPLGQLRKEEESQRLPTVRIGGKKRATAGQKKISYSEPEKLNQLEDQRDPNESWKKRNARSHSDEISEQDTRILRIKALESRGRALTRAELKQIQHKALLEYMERKTGQRTAPANNNDAQQQQQQVQNPPLQGRPSNPKRFSEDGSSSPSGKLQSADGLCRIPEPPSFPSAGTSIDGSINSASTKCLLRRSASSATSKGHGGSRSTPSPLQDFTTPTACLALSAEDHGHYQIHPKAESGQNSQGASHQYLRDKGETTMRHVPRPSPTDSAVGQAFEEPHRTKRNKDKFTSASDSPPLSPAPWLPGRRSLYANGQGESHDSSPVLSLTEMEEDVFKDSPASVSNVDPNLPHFPKQSMCLTVIRETPPRASTAPVLQIYRKGQQIKEQNTSFTVAGKSESNLGDSQEDENSAGNSHGPETTCEYLAFCLPQKSNANSQLKMERSETSQESGVSQEQLPEGNDRTHHSGDGAYHCTALSDSQGCKNTGCPLAPLQHDCACNVPVEAADSPVAQSKSPEDQICEDLADEIIAEDKSLVGILTPHPRSRKTTLELMEGLFPVHLSGPGRSYRWKEGAQSAQENDQRSSDPATDPSQRANNYLHQGAEGATFHIHQTLGKNKESSDDPENTTFNKRELRSSVQLKLQVLWEERELILSEAKAHAEHGKELESVVQGLCKPNEYERYMMFIGDLEKVVSLLLCLSSRLARVQNAMEKIDESTDAEEKHSLMERHRLLSRQREDAKDLKENLDRRERVVSGILGKYMTENQLQDYRHFVQEKTSLLIEQKDLDEQIRFLEEQLERLQTSIAP